MNAPPPPLAALIQMTSGIDPDANLATIDRALAAAAARGAAMAFLPELSLLLDRTRARSARPITRKTARPCPSHLPPTAPKHRLWLQSGRSEEGREGQEW